MMLENRFFICRSSKKRIETGASLAEDSASSAGKQTSRHGLGAFVLLSRLHGGNWPSGCRVAFNVVVVPGEVALEAILDVRRRFEFVIFARVHDKFGGAAQPLERLIHLLAAQNRNVPVAIPAHEQRRRGDAVDAIERRDLFPDGLILPRVAEFGFIIALVLVVAIKA